MKFLKLFFVAAASLVLFSCVQKEEMELVEENMAPIVRLGEEVLPDAVLVKFVSAPDESQLLSLEKEYDVTLERVFNSTPGKEELERKHGLDRWYKASFPETEDVDTKARNLARDRFIETVEYESICKNDAEDGVYAADDAPATRAGNAVFNDPYLTNGQPFAANALNATSNAPGKWLSDPASTFTHGEEELTVHLEEGLTAPDLMVSPNPPYIISADGAHYVDYRTDKGIDGLYYKQTDAVLNSGIYKSGAGAPMLRNGK